MSVVFWIIRIAIFLVLFGFAVKNSGAVSVRFYFDAVWHVPLVLVMLIAFVAGVVVGLGSLSGTVIRLRKEAAQLRGAATADNETGNPG